MKKWYVSRTIWAALISFVTVVILEATGVEVSQTLQAGALAIIMAVMRLITKEPISGEIL